MSKFRTAVVFSFWTLMFLTGSARCAVVEYRLETVDLDGVPITNVRIGSEFQLRVWVADVRPDPIGVLSAYLDVEYDASRVIIVADSLEHGPQFGDIARGDSSIPPNLDEFGSFRRGSPNDPMLPEPTGEEASLLFGIRFNANQPGQALFTSNPADIQPRHATTVFG